MKSYVLKPVARVEIAKPAIEPEAKAETREPIEDAYRLFVGLYAAVLCGGVEPRRLAWFVVNGSGACKRFKRLLEIKAAVLKGQQRVRADWALEEIRILEAQPIAESLVPYARKARQS
jgi:hypothetical protein